MTTKNKKFINIEMVQTGDGVQVGYVGGVAGMSQINYDKIKDRYGNALKKPVNKPTLEQSIFAWAAINELIELGYCHNFQCADSWVRDYIYDVSAIIDKANEIIEKDEQEESNDD